MYTHIWICWWHDIDLGVVHNGQHFPISTESTNSGGAEAS